VHHELGELKGRERAKLTLRDDGHFSDLGGRWVARFLADYVQSGGLE
jgi:hypothetical protein